MTGFQKIVKELSDRFEKHPDKNLIIGFTVGVIEKHKAQMIEENSIKIINSIKTETTK